LNPTKEVAADLSYRTTWEDYRRKPDNLVDKLGCKNKIFLFLALLIASELGDTS
jgi:hypothetical protein